MLNYYLNPRSLTIFCFGIASGFPWVLIGSMLTLWLQEVGLSRSSIGYAGAIFAAYSINWLWSPLVDRVRIPLLGLLGQRKSFIVLANGLIALCCLALSQTDAAVDSQTVILWCLAIAIFSASLDIAIDAYRIDSIKADEPELQTAGAAMATAGWWTGYAGVGFIPVALSDSPEFSWPLLYALMTIVPLAILVIALFRPEPEAKPRELGQSKLENFYLSAMATIPLNAKCFVALSLLAPFSLIIWAMTGFAGISSFSALPSITMIVGLLLVVNIAFQLAKLDKATGGVNTKLFNTPLDQPLAWLLVTLAQPVKDFFSRSSTKAAIAILLFIFLFKIGEAFLGRMSIVFYKELGFSNQQIGEYSKLLSWGVTIVFSLIGGIFTVKNGVFKGLVVGGIAMASSNLMFALMALAGPVEWLFALTA